ncbi:hypothetical protein PHMEG_00041118 [Phytophthora megakarya]|uniref:Uncharacterized protein n=1 Tax=Phytophthora megakarya TaxID=4795 RepID=A0A225UCI5_9STRA|nr:hypothetical protein PHMEG_00041118 [Phytophthora megakarya]
MVVESCGITKLVHERVLRRVGRAEEPLRAYRGILDSVSGHSIQVRGVIDLPVTLGPKRRHYRSCEPSPRGCDFGNGYIESFQGCDRLGRASVDSDKSGEVVPLGDSRIEECYGTDIETTVKLAPDKQAIVRANVKGREDPNSTVLIEGLAGGDGSLRVARTLCTVLDGQVVVEICGEVGEHFIAQRCIACPERIRTRSRLGSTRLGLKTSSSPGWRVPYRSSDLQIGYTEI